MKGQSDQRSGRPDASDEVVRLRGRLAEAEATLDAIRNGEVDAVVVEGRFGPQVYTLDGAEFDYRMLVESMNEGALVLARSGLILYANAHFAVMVGRPLEQVIGAALDDLLSAADRVTVRRLLRRPGRIDGTAEVLLERPSLEPLSARVSIRRMSGGSADESNIGMVVSDLSETRKREDLLRSFSQRLMRMQEAERQQMAADLGDNIAQLLCSILMRCQSLTDRLPTYTPNFPDETQEFAGLLSKTAVEVHRISANLRPNGLEVLGLVPALRAVAAEFADRLGLPILVNCARMAERLPADAELALYRVLQEALRNVEQHAHARSVTVTLKRRGSSVQLKIRDDGIGFDTVDRPSQAMQAGHFGLLSMRERATAVGGSLLVKSGAAAGTEVRLGVPVTPKLRRCR